MTTLGQLAGALDNGITFWGAFLLLTALLVIVGPRYIRAYAELIRARRDRQQSDDE